MPAKRILGLDGHPAPGSLSAGLIDAYLAKAGAAGHETRRRSLSKMAFDPDFGQGGYESWKPLEPDLESFLEDLEWCEHLVIAMPLWWGGPPAKLKGLFDRALLPGRAFDPRVLKLGLPTPLLTGRTARVMFTSDTPSLAFRLLYGWAGRRQMERQVLNFIGIRPTRFANFAPATDAAAERTARWIGKAERWGARAA